MTHRPLDHGVWRDPTETRTKYVPQVVNREVSYSRVLERCLPSLFHRGNRLARFDRAWKKELALVGLLLLPLNKNIVGQFGQGNWFLALPRFSGALRRVLATSVFNAALIVEGELGLLSRGFSAHISAQRLVRLLKSESVME